MNEYLRLADEYFRRFEGRHLYPGFKSWHWYAAVVALCVFIGTCAHALGVARPWSPFWSVRPGMAMVPLILVWAFIEKFKSTELKRIMGIASARPEFLDGSKCLALEDICAVNRTEFARIAKECKELLELERAYRPASSFEPKHLLSLVYNNDARPRLLAIILAGVALFATLLTRSVPDLPTVFDTLDDSEVWRFVANLVFISVEAFFLFLAFWFIGLLLVEGTARWIAKMGGSAYRSRHAMPYFIRDLVRLHRPLPKVAPTGEVDRLAAAEPTPTEPWTAACG